MNIIIRKRGFVLKMQDIKKSLFLNLASFSSYTVFLTLYADTHTFLRIYSNIMPIFVVICYCIFIIEVKRDKLFLSLPNQLTDNIVFIFLFFIGLLLSFQTLFVVLMILTDIIADL